MKIRIEINFNTDGDYYIEGYGYEYAKTLTRSAIPINLPDKQFNIYTSENNQHPHSNDYSFIKTFECENEDYCIMYAQSYLEEMLCNIRVSYTHYYLIQDFYELFDKAIKSMGVEGYYYDFITGNYEGTDLRILTQ